MLNPIVLCPAYGRTYQTAEAMKADWVAGKDFRDFRGTTGYCSIRDLKELTYLTSSITLYDTQSKVSCVVFSFNPMESF